MRRAACRAIKERGVTSGIRLIYVHFGDDDAIELVELYFKGDQENEDRARIIDSYG